MPFVKFRSVCEPLLIDVINIIITVWLVHRRIGNENSHLFHWRCARVYLFCWRRNLFMGFESSVSNTFDELFGLRSFIGRDLKSKETQSLCVIWYFVPLIVSLDYVKNNKQNEYGTLDRLTIIRKLINNNRVKVYWRVERTDNSTSQFQKPHKLNNVYSLLYAIDTHRFRCDWLNGQQKRKK